jgi:uncharacterized protein involved in type VI secretion and phage assembly
MSKEIQSEIFIDSEQLAHFTSAFIYQQFNDHHRFEIIVSQETLEKQGSHTLEKSQQLIGKNVTICFGEKSTSDNIFKGIITEVGMKQDQGLWGSVSLKGFSPTYLLESGYTYVSYYKKSLKVIIEKLKGELPAHEMKISIEPKFTKEITYITQYRESNFDFINRLAFEYGEWFYYNGEELFFGKPSEQPSIELLYGANIESMSFAMRVIPTNVMHYSYSSENDEVNQSLSPGKVEGSNSFMQHALKVSDALYQQPVNQPADIRTPDKKHLDEYAKIQKGAKAAGTVKLTAQGDHPKVKLGTHVKINVLQKEIKGEDAPEHGEYLVTNVIHYLSGIGEYSNTFEAIPSDNNYIPVNVERPVAETQMAIVKENNDPKKLGRVRVQMLWQQKNNDLTDWIRVLTPDAGSSDKVSKNRGFVFIPEVNDQVLLGFRYNDPNRPFVLGSMFHGKIAEGGNDENHSKSLTTRSGNKIMMDDKKGSVVISDPSGNIVTMHGDGTISIHAPKTINFTATDINMNAANSINLTAKPDKDGGEGTISFTAEKNLAVLSETKSVFITSKKEDVNLEAKEKNINIKATEDMKMEGKVLTGKATTKMLLDGGSQLQASSGDSNFI